MRIERDCWAKWTKRLVQVHFFSWILNVKLHFVCVAVDEQRGSCGCLRGVERNRSYASRIVRALTIDRRHRGMFLWLVWGCVCVSDCGLRLKPLSLHVQSPRTQAHNESKHAKLSFMEYTHRVAVLNMVPTASPATVVRVPTTITPQWTKLRSLLSPFRVPPLCHAAVAHSLLAPPPVQIRSGKLAANCKIFAKLNRK